MVLDLSCQTLSSHFASQRGYGRERNIWDSHDRGFDAPALDTWRGDEMYHQIVAVVKDGRQGLNPSDRQMWLWCHPPGVWSAVAPTTRLGTDTQGRLHTPQE